MAKTLFILHKYLKYIKCALNYRKLPAFYEKLHKPPYEKLKPLKSGFIENSNFENNRGPWLQLSYMLYLLVVSNGEVFLQSTANAKTATRNSQAMKFSIMMRSCHRNLFRGKNTNTTHADISLSSHRADINKNTQILLTSCPSNLGGEIQLKIMMVHVRQ